MLRPAIALMPCSNIGPSVSDRSITNVNSQIRVDPDQIGIERGMMEL